MIPFAQNCKGPKDRGEEEEVEETLVNVFKVDINKDKVPGGGGGIFNNNKEEEEEEVKEEENVIVPYIVGGNDIVTPRKYPVSSFYLFHYCCNFVDDRDDT